MYYVFSVIWRDAQKLSRVLWVFGGGMLMLMGGITLFNSILRFAPPETLFYFFTIWWFLCGLVYLYGKKVYREAKRRKARDNRLPNRDRSPW